MIIDSIILLATKSETSPVNMKSKYHLNTYIFLKEIIEKPKVFICFPKVCLANLLGKPRKIHRKPMKNRGKTMKTLDYSPSRV